MRILGGEGLFVGNVHGEGFLRKKDLARGGGFAFRAWESAG
jgi:hypothetical protein